MFSQACVIPSFNGGGVYPSMQWDGGVSQHTMGQGVCIPACNWAGVSVQWGCLPRGCPVADLGFPRGGGTNSPGGGAPTYDFAKFSQKLHEIERIWAPGGGGRASKILLCRSATGVYPGGVCPRGVSAYHTPPEKIFDMNIRISFSPKTCPG